METLAELLLIERMLDADIKDAERLMAQQIAKGDYDPMFSDVRRKLSELKEMHRHTQLQIRIVRYMDQKCKESLKRKRTKAQRESFLKRKYSQTD